LSPVLFNIHIDDLIGLLSTSGYGCHVDGTFYGCTMYADDLLILSPLVCGLQQLFNFCYGFYIEHDILFNSKKSVCLVSGARMYSGITENMHVGNQEMQGVNEFKYLCMNFIAKKNLEVNLTPIIHKFYAALNSVLCKCKSAAKPVKLELVKSFCLPLLSYSIGAVEFKSKALAEMSVCWNDAFRKILHFNGFESVKELMLFCNEFDFRHNKAYTI
jgi:hypothetical protein